MIHPRAAELIASLALQPHPEGGYFRRHYVSDREEGARPAASAILFLLVAGQVSRWHRVDADELWFFHEGAPLTLHMAEPGRSSGSLSLGPATAGQLPCHRVPAHAWQAARTEGPYTLVSCAVVPAFEFAGFRLLADEPDQIALLDIDRSLL